MKVGKKQLLAFLIGSVLLLTACGGKKADNTYHDAIAALPENTYSATVDIGLDKPVLLVTDGVYDDGNGNEAAIYCDVYYPVGKKIQKIGSVESMGTAYPIAYSKDGIYAALDRGVQKYNVDKQVTIHYLDGHQKVVAFDDLESALADNLGDVVSIHSCEPTLEDIFITLTGGKLNV